MRSKLLVIAVFTFGMFTAQAQEYKEMIDIGTYKVQDIIDSAEAYFDGKDKGRGTGYKQFKRWEYNAKRMMNEDGFLPTVVERIVALQNYNAYLNETAQSRPQLMDNWQEIGPTSYNPTTSWNPGVGRITSLAVDNANNDHIIVGSHSGGVWKTNDAGDTWEPLNDNFTEVDVYSVALDPQDSDVYFFGSNSGLIFKSIDAGATWNLLADISNSRVIKILIHPANSDIMFASSENAGTFKSSDGGLTWALVTSEGRSYDVEFKPGDPSVVYASGWGVYKSLDGGDSFSTIMTASIGPKMMGVSEDDSERLYVISAQDGTFGGFFRSINSGDTFTEIDHGSTNYFGYSTQGDDNSGQAPRDMDIAVHPNNADEVHIAGILTWRSTNAGDDFTCTADWIPSEAINQNIGYCHADVDIMEFVGSTLYVGSDGGIFKAENTGTINANYYENITEGLGIRQFYKIGVSQTEDVVITGGAQDNGTSFYNAADGWRDWLGADGMEGFVDKTNTDRMFGMIQFGSMYRTHNGGNTIVNLSEPGIGGGAWVTPFLQDPVLENTIYLGYDRVHKSINNGSTWTSISQSFSSNLVDIEIAKSNNEVLYASRGVVLYRTEDGGTTDWLQTSNPGGIINGIAVHPANPNLVAVATTSLNKVYVSRDGGETWENYKKNLPSLSALDLVWDHNGREGLYLGMNTGVYYIDNTLDDWQPYSNNLPNVVVNELEINTETRTLYAATYGRGLWASPLLESTLGVNDVFNISNIAIYPNPANSQVTISLKEAAIADIRVFDVNGKLLIYQKDILIGNTYSLHVASLPSGVYFIRINSEEGTVTKKLLKQ